MGVRICPHNGQPVEASDTFFMQATSAETNVASISSYLGLPVNVLTAFVKGSPIAEFIKRDLRARGMAYEGPEVPQGGPWGYRHQFNIADSGCGSRGPRVHNDRAGEIGRTLNIADFDLDRLFGQEGVQIIHLSGLIAALSPETGQFCLELARAAKKYGTRIAFDLNHRATFWKGREENCTPSLPRLPASRTSLWATRKISTLPAYPRSRSRGKDLAAKIDSFKGMIQTVKATFPNASVFATTLREVVDVSTHLWGAIMLNGDEWQVAQPREIKILDRIGGGDGFVGGLLYGILKGWDSEKWIRFGWATGALATTFLTDYAQTAGRGAGLEHLGRQRPRQTLTR
jgi:2-dehydro-3-deoxygluconokinase